MPYSYAVYTGNGSTTQFSVPFPYIRREHVFVSVNFAPTAFTWVNNTTVQVSPAPASAARVEVRRKTPVDQPLVDFTDGSTLVAADLDTNALQQTYINQEQDDQFNDGVFTNAQGLPDAGGKRITNVGSPTGNNDAATKGYTDNWFNTYGENYLGAYTSDPATKPSGGALVTGNLYFNTATGRLRVYSANAGTWSDGAAPTTLFRWKKTAVGGETSLSGNDDDTVPLTYTADYEQVYVNGALLARGVDYVAINGTTITGLAALTAGDVVEVLSFNAFTVGTVPTEVNFTAMPAATQPIADSDLFLVRQGTTNKKVTASIFRTELATGAQAAQAAAELAEANAELAETNAETAQAAAELARNQAQVARDDALLNAGIYPNVAAGLAATALNNYFKTYSGNTNDFLDLYRVDAGPVATLVTTYPSRAFFSFFNLDSVYDEFYRFAWVDTNNRLAFGVKPDGTVRIEKADLGAATANSLAVNSITAPGGSIDLDSVDTPLVNIAEGGSIDGDNVYNESFAYALTDNQNRIALGITPSGSLYLAGVQSLITFGQAHGASGLYTVTTDAFSRAQIQVGNNNGVTTLTSAGNNWAPEITTETPERVAFQSDRTAGIRYWVMNADGTRQARAVPDKNDVTFWGDSMTQRLQSYAHLPGLLPGRTLTYNALGGTTVEHIIARQGGENATCTIPSGSIPASGSVVLRNVWPSLGYHAGTLSAGNTYSYLVTIAGVQGTLTSTTNASSQADYTFTRSAAGSSVPVVGPVEIVVLSNITQSSFGFSKSNTAVFWLGTNALSGLPSSAYDPNAGTGIYFKSPATTYDPSNSSAVQARTEALTQALINRVENLDRHVLIVGPFIGGGAVWSTGVENLAKAAGFATFSKHWYDLRTDFIATCKTWLQTNYPAVYANWSASDDTHVANGASPPILREDGIHLNTYGSELVSQLIASKLTSKGW